MKKHYSKKEIISIIYCFVILTCNYHATAQQNKNDLISFFNTINQQYSKETLLSYQIKYKYANEREPDLTLDSLTATVIMHGKKYYYAADSTEVFSNDSLSIALFNENKMMYLSRPKPASAYTPVSILNSFLLKENLSYSISENLDKKVLQISFPKASDYKEIIISLNKKTNMIDMAKYTVKTNQLMNSDASTEDLNNYDKYAIVTAEFSENKSTDTTLLNFEPSAFYKKADNELIAVGKYKNYSISIGSLDF